MKKKKKKSKSLHQELSSYPYDLDKTEPLVQDAAPT